MRHHLTISSLLAAILLSVTATAVQADRGPGPDNRDQWRERETYRLDQRHQHYRYYPPRGLYVDRLPPRRIVVPWHNDRYYFDAGVWYRPYGSRFVVVAPPIGLTVSILPPFYTTLWVGGVPYYYADGVYYTWRPHDRTYVVVDPPRESDITSLPSDQESLFIYPKAGQSEQQQANDRYECHRWAVGQTGFDPTQPGQSGLSQDQYAERNADYQRASRACLEARDYSVR